MKHFKPYSQASEAWTNRKYGIPPPFYVCREILKEIHTKRQGDVIYQMQKKNIPPFIFAEKSRGGYT